MTMSRAERALQIWQVLIGAAHNRQTLTYEMLGNLIGMPRFTLAQSLRRVMDYCEQHELPRLTVLVVQEHIGRPKPGLKTQDPDRDRERVFNYPWFQFGPLQASDFEGVPASSSPVKGA